MNRLNVLKKLLPGLIPLLIFVIADEFFGTRSALIISIFTGIAEFIFIYLKSRKFDSFIILDTLLLVVMGGVSLILENDIFFKLKPAIIELILCVLIGISVFTPENLLLKMSKRYLRGIEINDFQVKLFNKTLKSFFFVLLVHIILIIYAAYFLSDKVWAFVSSILFYILFGVFVVYEYFKNKLLIKKYQQEEWLPLVDAEGHILGKAPRALCHQGKGMLHPVVHLHVFNEKNELYLQKRPLNKKIQPGKWDTAVGGHISFGNTVEQGLYREAFEELNLQNFKAVFINKYIWETRFESELIYMFFTQTNQKIRYNSEEIADGKFWTIHDIENNIGKGIFTPNFENEYPMLKEVISLLPLH